jgi:GT2 family glycosyltransferase
VEKRAAYWLCRYIPGAIPPSGGMTLYRRGLLAASLQACYRFLDVDVPVILSKAGHQDFAYVPGAGFYHMHARSLRELIHKRLRSLEGTYLPDASTRDFRWFDLTTPKGIGSIALWVVLAHLFFPLAIRSAVRAMRRRDAVFLYEPVLAVVLTDVILWAFLRNPQGREVIKRGLRRLLGGAP